LEPPKEKKEKASSTPKQKSAKRTKSVKTTDSAACEASPAVSIPASAISAIAVPVDDVAAPVESAVSAAESGKTVQQEATHKEETTNGHPFLPLKIVPVLATNEINAAEAPHEAGQQQSAIVPTDTSSSSANITDAVEGAPAPPVEQQLTHVEAKEEMPVSADNVQQQATASVTIQPESEEEDSRITEAITIVLRHLSSLPASEMLKRINNMSAGSSLSATRDQLKRVLLRLEQKDLLMFSDGIVYRLF
jgi:3-dehydroquinate dehydratase